MSVDFKWITCTTDPIWEQTLQLFPKELQDIYFHPAYCALYEIKRGEANCYIYKSCQQIFLYPFLLREIPQATGFFDIITPYGYGGPIYNCVDQVFIADALATFKCEAKKRNVIAEVIKFHPLLTNHLALASFWGGSILPVCPTVFVELETDEKVRWHDVYSHANRKSIVKAQKAGLTVTFGQDSGIWRRFKALYESTMQHNQAKDFYYFPENYYQYIKTYCEGRYTIANVWFEGEIISSLLVLLGAKFVHCHLIGSDRTYHSLGSNNLLHHELILWAKAKDYSVLHLGGGRSNSNDDTLLKFKKNFSKQLSCFHIGEHIINQKKYDDLILKYNEMMPDASHSLSLLKYREIPKGCY